MIRLIKAIAFWAALSAGLPAQALPTVIYSNDFEAGSPGLTDWSIMSDNGIYAQSPDPYPLPLRSLGTDVTPVGAQTFLGQFGGNDAVTLSLTGIAPASALRVDFDVYFIRSWDGNWANNVPGYLNNDINRVADPNVPLGPDYFGFSANGTSMLFETFGLGDPTDAAQWQTYCPGGAAPCLPGTGGVEWRTLGYTVPPFISGAPSPFDSDMTVHFSWLLPYSADLTLTFLSQGLQLRPTAFDDPNTSYGPWQGQGNLVLDESWGLDNVSVTAVPEPGTYALMAVGLALMALVSRRRRHRAH